MFSMVTSPLLWKGDAEGNVTKVTVKPNFTITMPNWSGHKRQLQKCQDEWKDMIKALWKHENGHRALFEARVLIHVNDLEELQAATESDIKTVIVNTNTAGKKEQKTFDIRTNYGFDRGVKLDIWEECRSKSKRGTQ